MGQCITTEKKKELQNLETLEQAESQKVEGKYKDPEEQTNSFNI